MNIELQHIRILKSDFDKLPIIRQCIGKRSGAHHAAYNTFTKKRTPDMIVRYQDIARFVVK